MACDRVADATPDRALAPPDDAARPEEPSGDPLRCFWAAAPGEDEPPRGQYLGADVRWPVSHCEGTANQGGRTVPEAELDAVLFVGDGSLLRVPLPAGGGPPIIGNASAIAALRGRLTERFVNLYGLAPPERDLERDKGWYHPNADGVGFENHQGAFSVCAQYKAGWRDLHTAVNDEGLDDDDHKLSRSCLEAIPNGEGGRLLVIVSFGEYGPDDLNEDEREFGVVDDPEPDQAEPLIPEITRVLDSLRVHLEGRGFGEVVLVVVNLPSWRAGSDRGPCPPTANERWYTRRVAHINTALVAESRAHRYDVVFADEYVRSRGAACLADGREPAACRDAVDDPAVAHAEALTVDDDGCCWMEAPACATLDTNGHLGFGALVEDVVSAVLPPPI
ncbi:MAG: hypothetical protein H6701_16575 [Myxococcales bacterium]|nr:hypothetical protein [Myxococcales bacterium]